MKDRLPPSPYPEYDTLLDLLREYSDSPGRSCDRICELGLVGMGLERNGGSQGIFGVVDDVTKKDQVEVMLTRVLRSYTVHFGREVAFRGIVSREDAPIGQWVDLTEV